MFSSLGNFSIMSVSFTNQILLRIKMGEVIIDNIAMCVEHWKVWAFVRKKNSGAGNIRLVTNTNGQVKCKTIDKRRQKCKGQGATTFQHLWPLLHVRIVNSAVFFGILATDVGNHFHSLLELAATASGTLSTQQSRRHLPKAPANVVAG